MHSTPGHERLRLPRWIRWWVYGVGGVCAASGALWLVFHHFVSREGTFGPEPHPLEHVYLMAHGVSGLVLLWVFGLVWLPHVRRGWGQRRHRLVGGTMATAMVWLALSAAGLYYLGEVEWRGGFAVSHWAVGLFAAAWLPLHIWLGRRKMRHMSTA